MWSLTQVLSEVNEFAKFTPIGILCLPRRPRLPLQFSAGAAPKDDISFLIFKGTESNLPGGKNNKQREIIFPSKTCWCLSQTEIRSPEASYTLTVKSVTKVCAIYSRTKVCQQTWEWTSIFWGLDTSSKPNISNNLKTKSIIKWQLKQQTM